ncbi:hypothetical protein RI054_02g09660 [Pseudoscourfieldia marina]
MSAEFSFLRNWLGIGHSGPGPGGGSRVSSSSSSSVSPVTAFLAGFLTALILALVIGAQHVNSKIDTVLLAIQRVQNSPVLSKPPDETTFHSAGGGLAVVDDEATTTEAAITETTTTTTTTTTAAPAPAPVNAASGATGEYLAYPPPAPDAERERANAEIRSQALAFLGLNGGLQLNQRERCGVVDKRFRRPFMPFGTPFATTNTSNMNIRWHEWIKPAMAPSFHGICNGNGDKFLDAPHEPDTLLPWTPPDPNLPSPFKETPLTLDDVVFVVMTHPRAHGGRAAAQKKGWASYPGIRVKFISEGADSNLPTTVLDKLPPDMKSEGRLSKMWAKALHILSHVRTMLHDLNCPKWIVIADDDSFILPRRYLELLSHMDPDVPIHAGSGAAGAYAPYHGLPYHEGGPSYVFSWSGLEVIADAIDEGLCPSGRCVWPPPYTEEEAPSVSDVIRRDVCPNKDHAPIANFGDMSTGVCAHQVGMYVIGMPGLYSQRQGWDPTYGPFEYHKEMVYPAGFHYIDEQRQVEFWGDGTMNGFCKTYKSLHSQGLAKYKRENPNAPPHPSEAIVDVLRENDAKDALRRGEESSDPLVREQARQRHLRRRRGPRGEHE